MQEDPNSDKQLKLIAIVLPEPLFSMVREEQNFIAKTWGCRQALRVPPHITLIPPLSVKEKESKEIESVTKEVAAHRKPFTMKITGYDTFSPRVIFLKPNFPYELGLLYNSLRDSIIPKIPQALNRYPDESFHPHITLAYRDLTPDQFKEMWRHYKNKKAKYLFDVNQISILVNTEDGWVIENTFQLGN
jgi:2'-5' RNA ligase